MSGETNVVEEVKDNLVQISTPVAKSFVTKEELDQIQSLERESMQTEKMLVETTIRKKQIVDRIITLNVERQAAQNNLFAKYNIPQGSNVFIKDDLEIVVNPPAVV